MSGHSHWAGIKHRKGVNDAQKAKIFTKHGKLIAIAAREGGGKPETNFQLRLAVDRAKRENMPKDKIEKAIQRGVGEIRGEEISEIIYEAVGPEQILMLIKTATDNRNRTVSEIKNILLKSGGKLGEKGGAMWNFEPAGMIVCDLNGKSPDEAELLAIDSGAKDTKISGSSMEVFASPEEWQKIRERLEKGGLKITDAGPVYLPKNTVEISLEAQKTYEKLLEALDEQDDVQEIYDNIK